MSVADRETQGALEQSENNTGGREMQPHRRRDEYSSRKRRCLLSLSSVKRLWWSGRGRGPTVDCPWCWETKFVIKTAMDWVGLTQIWGERQGTCPSPFQSQVEKTWTQVFAQLSGPPSCTITAGWHPGCDRDYIHSWEFVGQDRQHCSGPGLQTLFQLHHQNSCYYLRYSEQTGSVSVEVSQLHKLYYRN